MELKDIKGLGPKRLALLAQLNIRTPEELLRFYPREYLDYTQATEIHALSDGDRASIRVTALAEPTIFYNKGKYIVSLRVADATGKATLRWMNQPYRLNQFHTGERFLANGLVSKKRGVVLYNPQINRENGGIVPIYPSVKGLTQTVIREAVNEILGQCKLQDILPVDWLQKYDLIGYTEAVRNAHFPVSTQTLAKAKKRLSFEETVLYLTAIRSFSDDRNRKNGFTFRTDHIFERFLHKISFVPTASQIRAMRDVEKDMRSDRPMNRLIQGDVGSGKTLIAEFALTVAAQNGKQGVLLAPTEILARQHYETLKRQFPDVQLFVGSMTQKEKTEALRRIAVGETRTIAGTHALLSESVKFRDLGLVVTDEQHRFGVMQRAAMEAKGIRPDVLVMSATPIPRTLALLLYADLDLTVIDELPPGRKPIKTLFVPQSRRKDLYLHLASRAEKGERAYVVCPLIEPTEGYEGLSLEELSREIKEWIPDTPVGSLHGQMHEREKTAIMEDFRSGKLSILIATTVIEVGVDVPEAASMVIEGADHFGLATLHQLRGRVGRGQEQSYCYLLAKKAGESARSRIEAMIETNDGFTIAQRDLDMRGSGDLFGVRQSGDGEINGILSGGTVEIIEKAAAAADEIYALPNVQHNLLLAEARKRYQKLETISHN